MGRSFAGYIARNRRRPGFRKSDSRRAQQKKQFTGPEQNVQQTRPLKIVQIFGLQTDIKGFSGAFLDESSHGSQVQRFFGRLAASGIHGIKLFIASLQKVVQAKSLLIQGSNRGAATSILAAAPSQQFRVHLAQVP